MLEVYDSNRGLFGLGATDEESLRAIQEYPALAARVASLQADQTAMQTSVSLWEANNLANAPASVRARLGELTKATVTAASNLSELRQRIREGVAKAKQQGTIGASELETLEAAGLAGLSRSSLASRLANATGYAGSFYRGGASSWASTAPGIPGGVEGLGYMPSVVASSASAFTTAAARSGYASARTPRGMRGLGVVPLVIIGYALAVAIGAAIVTGTLLVAWRATAESTARAEAIRDQARASLDAWQAQVASQGSPGVAKPLPPLPGVPGEPGGVLATVARAATPIALVGALALAAYFLHTRKRS